MKYVIGILLIVVGAALGLYLGIWVFLVGGIVNIADGLKANPTNSGLIAWGAIEVIFLAEIAGYGAFLLCSAVAGWIMSSDSNTRRSGKSNRQVEIEWERRMRGGF